MRGTARFRDERIKSQSFYEGGFYSDDGYGYEVLLHPGWTDQHGAHSLRAANAKDMNAKLRMLKFCDCEQCAANNPVADPRKASA